MGSFIFFYFRSPIRRHGRRSRSPRRRSRSPRRRRSRSRSRSPPQGYRGISRYDRDRLDLQTDLFSKKYLDEENEKLRREIEELKSKTDAVTSLAATGSLDDKFKGVFDEPSSSHAAFRSHSRSPSFEPRTQDILDPLKITVGTLTNTRDVLRSSYSPHRQEISRSPSPLPRPGNYGNFPEPQPNKFFDRLEERDRVCNDIQAPQINLPQIIWVPQLIRPSTGPNIAQKEARKDKETVNLNVSQSAEKVFPNPVPNIPNIHNNPKNPNIPNNPNIPTLSMVQEPNTDNLGTVKNVNPESTRKRKRKRIKCIHCSEMFNDCTIKIHS